MKRTRKTLAILLAALILSNLGGVFSPAVAAPSGDEVIINQVYGGGGKSDTPISHSFIELYNDTDRDIDLSPYSIQLSNGANLVMTSWMVLPLTGKTIPARSSFLIVGTKYVNDGTAGEPGRNVLNYTIPDNKWDMEWDIEISNRSIGVALVEGMTPLSDTAITGPDDKATPWVMDLAGARNATGDPMPSYWGSPARISRQEAIRRNDFQNTANNAVDFSSMRYSEFSLTAIAINRPRWSGDGEWEYTKEGTTLREHLMLLGRIDPSGWNSDMQALYNAAMTNGQQTYDNSASTIGEMTDAITAIIEVLTLANSQPNAYFANDYAKVGEPLNVQTVGVMGTISYAWSTGRVNNGGSVTWTNVSGNNTRTFTPASGDMDRFIRCIVTASGFSKEVIIFASALPVVYIDLDGNFSIDNIITTNNFSGDNFKTIVLEKVTPVQQLLW